MLRRLETGHTNVGKGICVGIILVPRMPKHKIREKIRAPQKMKSLPKEKFGEKRSWKCWPFQRDSVGNSGKQFRFSCDGFQKGWHLGRKESKGPQAILVHAIWGEMHIS